MRTGFRRDEAGAFDMWTAVQIGLLALIPMALFVFWWYYLRRIGQDEAAKNPMFPSKLQPGAASAPRDTKRTCARCGLTVNPPRGAWPPTCPNCMSVL